MLVIRRRAGETLIIGDNVEVEILEITASQVKIGIRAPREIPVVRGEIQLTAEQNRTAANLPDDAMEHLLRKFRRVTPGDRSSPPEAPLNGPVQS
jgi:carbon storage regulator